jgi:hypothetical protein
MYVNGLYFTDHIISLWSHYISGYWSFTMDAGFVCAKDPVTAAMLRLEIKNILCVIQVTAC